MNLTKKICLILTLLTVTFSQNNTNTSCPLYRCSQANLNESVCTFTKNSTFTGKDGATFTTLVTDIDLKRCPAGTFCPASAAYGEVKCMTSPVYKKVDGEACQGPTDCFSGSCESSKCVGLNDGTLCDATDQCKVGSYCTGNNKTDPGSTCKKQVAENGTCTFTSDCINSHVCHDSKCIKVFTLPENTTTLGTENPTFCASNYVYGGVCTELNYLGASDYKLPSDGKCIYNFTARNQNISMGTGEGECAYDGSFQRYCPTLGTETSLFKEYTNKLKNWYNGDALNVHSIRRAVYSKDIVELYQKVVNFPHLQNADKCALNLFGISSNTAMVSLSVFSLIGFFLILL